MVQVQSVKEIRLDEIDMTLKCTLEAGLGMKLSSPGGCFSEKLQCHRQSCLAVIESLNPCTEPE